MSLKDKLGNILAEGKDLANRATTAAAHSAEEAKKRAEAAAEHTREAIHNATKKKDD
jgi:ElaB/YqjD/DUF883 family membrane-anchored ribosome-binding protein